MKRAFIKETGIYFLPAVFQALIIPSSLFFYTKVMSKADYGMLGLINVTTVLLLIFSNWGLVNGMVRFLGDAGEDKDKLVGTAYYGSLFAGLVIFSIFYVNSYFFSQAILGSASYRDILIIGVATAIFGMAFQAFQDFMRMKKMPGIYVSFEIAKNVGVFFLGVYLAYFLKLGLFGVVLAVFYAQAALLVIQYLYFRPRYDISFSWPHFKKMLMYGAPFTIIILGTWVLDSADRYILKNFVNMGDIGIYNVAYSYGFFMQSFVSPFVLAALPYLFNFYYKGEYRSKAGKMAFYYIVFYMGLVLALSFLAKPYFLILTPKQFHPAIYIAPIISLAYGWRGLFNIFCFCNTLTGNAKVQFIVEIGAAVLNIALNFILIPFLGLYGAAIATLVAWLWLILLAYIYNQRILPIDLPKKKIFEVICVGLLCFIAILLLNRCIFWPAGIICIIAYAIFVHYRVYSINSLINSIRLKFAGV